MSTTFDNSSHSGSTIAAATGNDIIFGTASFWTNGGTAPIVGLSGSNLFRNAGQVYADASAVVSSAGFIQIEILATGIVSSSTATAISLADDGNSVFNAGYVAGATAIRFAGSGNFVNNIGTLVGEGDAIEFGNGVSDEGITNSGTILSHYDDAIEFNGSGVCTVNNSGLLSAMLSTAVLQIGTGRVTITNSGTIFGREAIVTNLGNDVVLNSGTISGFVFLDDGDDFFDSSTGIVNGPVSGDLGNDTLIGGASRDRLEGADGDDLLVGNGGDDVLTGGEGADDIDGGNGRDTAIFTDEDGVTVDLADPGANTGSAIGDTFTGIENLTGRSGDDVLSGDAQRNVLRGQGGDDTLDGRGGSDVLIGGAGDDTYIVDSARDRIAEVALEGIDTVRASVGYTLSAEVDNLTLTGTGAIDATGNVLDNLLVGNAAANILAGDRGDDRLTGGGGADIFVFNSDLNPSTNVDTITDFLVGTDKIQLSRAIFTDVNGGPKLLASRFVVGGAAGDANDRIIYNAATGLLFYDADGTGASAQVQFAQIGAGLALTATDFLLVG